MLPCHGRRWLASSPTLALSRIALLVPEGREAEAEASPYASRDCQRPTRAIKTVELVVGMGENWWGQNWCGGQRLHEGVDQAAILHQQICWQRLEETYWVAGGFWRCKGI